MANEPTKNYEAMSKIGEEPRAFGQAKKCEALDNPRLAT
jgi:hypothetical protein